MNVKELAISFLEESKIDFELAKELFSKGYYARASYFLQ